MAPLRADPSALSRDVDGDGNAEIVATADENCGYRPLAGVFVYGDTNDGWIATRKIWNQHTYHITNVSDDGTIPARETNNWEVYNNYRQNRLTSGCEYARPDLTASYLRRDDTASGIDLTIRIGNSGGAVAGPLPVSLYSGEPGAGGTLLTTRSTTTYIPSGGFEDLVITLPAGTVALPVWAVADDQGGLVGTQTESDETNNAYGSRLYLTATPNAAPSVQAGPDQVLVLPQSTATLEGIVSDDGLPIGQVTTAWGVVDGPGTVTFADPSAPSTTATFEVAGAYRLRLHASDADTDAADDIDVLVRPRQPDLAIASLDTGGVVTNGQTLAVSGQARVEVANLGVEPAAASAVVVYEERDGVVGFDGAADVLLGRADVEALPAGGSTTAVVPVAGAVSFRGVALHAFVDPDRLIIEWDESNNHAVARACDRVGGCAGTEPDLVPSYVRKTMAADAVTVTVRIGNAGAGTAPAGVVVGLYDGAPSAGRLLATAATASSLGEGAFEDVVFALATTVTASPLFVSADDPAAGGGVVAESDESNNVYDSHVYVPDRANDPPSVDAGPDQVVAYPLREAVLAATVTDDGIPGPLALGWRQTGGQGVATFADPAAAGTQVTFSAPGTYELQLDADDGELVGSDTVVVTVDAQNRAPLVMAGPDLAVTKPTFALDGTVTDDGLPRGAALSMSWVQTAGPAAATMATPMSADTAVSVTVAGTYAFVLQASDSELAASDAVTVTG